MALPVVEIQSQPVNALRTQASHKSQHRVAEALACPYYDHQGKVFQNLERLVAHTKGGHPSELAGLGEEEAKRRIRNKVIQAQRLASTNDLVQDQMRAPDIADLSLEPVKERHSSRPSGKTRRADFELGARRGTTSTPVEIADSNNSRDVPKWQESRGKPHGARLYNLRYGNKDTSSPRRSSTETKNESSHVFSPASWRQSGLIELEKHDQRYPGLLLRPDSRPISQEQLASEVKSIYAGLTMVETKCIHVDRAQAAALKDTQGGKLAPDHWQALIALHRTLFRKHHDFFQASQHSKANPALRRLAAKYTIPTQMWRHGIHSFLELLRQRVPQSLDYRLAFEHVNVARGVDFDRLRRLFLLRASRRAIAPQDESKLSTSSCAGGRGQSYPTEDKIKKDTATPVHVISTFLSTSMSFIYTSRTVQDFPWAELVSFVNAAVKSEVPKTSSLAPNGITLFSSTDEKDRDDDLPLPEDYSIRGLVWTQEHLPTQRFSGGKRVRNNLSGRILRGYSNALKLGYMLPIASLPKVYAYDATSLAPGLLLRKAEIFDYVGYGLMLPCMGLLWWLGSKTTELSFTATLLFAFLWIAATNTSSLLEIRTTIIQIWTVFSFNYVARDCSEATHPRLHLLKYTVLSALFATFGAAVQSTQDDKVLKVIPPAVALASVVLSFIPKDNQAHNLQARDVERALPHRDVELERVAVARP